MQIRSRWGIAAGAICVCLLLLLSLVPNALAETESEASGAEAPPERFDEALERLDKEEFDLGLRLESLRLDVDSAERRFAAAQEKLDAEVDPSPALREEVAARRLQLSTAQRSVSLLEQRLERVKGQQLAWQRLHQLATRRVPPEELTDWSAESEHRVDALSREIAVKQGRVEELGQEVQFTRERREQADRGSPGAHWLGIQARVLDELEERYAKDVSSLEASLAVERRLGAQLAQETRAMPLEARLRAFLHQLREFWNYELTASQEEPITPGKLVSALFIFVIGYALALFVSRALGRRVFARMRLDEGAAQAFQSLAFYLLLVVAFLTALRMVQIPLTAFAVVGGALAIGVGFGSQNVVNNFISGIILLAERPIKIGDLIEVAGVYGNVESIGLRSTRVRTGDNVHIIVPNASFLENNVVNWTHTDRRVRVKITVGIVYGSPTRDAERIIRQVLQEHPAVLASPEPVVLFMDFGDNALIFEMRFWIEMRTIMDRLRVESEVRFRIDDLYREAGIVIAFPQRDVHLDATAPLDIRLVKEASDAHEA
jgi:small-conductance mechanosensitive channel